MFERSIVDVCMRLECIFENRVANILEIHRTKMYIQIADLHFK
jgi:hypothetical protein